ncbi:MAG: NAD-dependent epimerase/dehydratase family protein, partial [Sphingobacterium siyangense]
MKITITGSLGNIGRHLVDILIKQGHEVSVISSSPERASEIEHLGAKAL